MTTERNKLGIAFLTKDRCDLSRRSIEPLLGIDADILWIDGSVSDEGMELPYEYDLEIHTGIRGGPDAAVVYALSTLLQKGYEYIGLVENDVLLPSGWLGSTFGLFERGFQDGLHVGSVSARCYEDRILIQRDGYAVLHNHGWGTQIMTREAADLTLRHFRNTHTMENRRLFHQVSGLDIGKWWAFRGAEQFLTADWGDAKVLAAHGLASLALTPSNVEMIGQEPSLGEQGLKIADGAFDLLRDDKAFKQYQGRLDDIRKFKWKPAFEHFYRDGSGSYVIFPHQLRETGGYYIGDWKLQFAQGFGPFAWKVGHPYVEQIAGHAGAAIRELTQVIIPVSGPCNVIVSGGEEGGKVKIVDMQSGYVCDPTLPPEKERGALNVSVPGQIAYRAVCVTALSPGLVFYGIAVREPQPDEMCRRFDWQDLPGSL